MREDDAVDGLDGVHRMCRVDSTKVRRSPPRFMAISVVSRFAHLAHQHHVRVLPPSTAGRARENDVVSNPTSRWLMTPCRYAEGGTRPGPRW
jgi:hypothetical protein